MRDGQSWILVERHRYGPFGAPELFEENGFTAITLAQSVIEPMWRGMAMLGHTGLYLTPQRLYDPEVGAFYLLRREIVPR